MLQLILANAYHKPTDYMVLIMHTIRIRRVYIFTFRWDERHSDGRGKEGKGRETRKEGGKKDEGEHTNSSVSVCYSRCEGPS